MVAPDDFVSTQPVFDFTRLGVRVPAVLVSPLVQPGSVDATQYDHSSISATVNKVFGLGAASFLGRRDAAANTFDRNFGAAPALGLLPGFKADTSSGPPLTALAPPDATVAGTRKAIETVLTEATQLPLASMSSHQRRLIELSHTVLNSLP